jgi:heterodisulfide reductase subunit A
MDMAYSPDEEGKLVVQAEDTLLGIQRRIPVDMVILSPAMEARADSKEIARLFGLVCDKEGFFPERHPKLDPAATMNGGIFIAGACQGPKDITDTVSQAGAAASRVVTLLGKGIVELEPICASINKELCSGCRICTALCPYGAVSFNEADKSAEVNQLLCQGCGTCVAACPAQAIEGPHFTDEQIMAEIESCNLFQSTGKGDSCPLSLLSTN